MIHYEKPTVSLTDGAAEGVFLSSGVVCDCFTVPSSSILERPNAGTNRYWCNFEIHHNAAATHSVTDAWSSLTVTCTFDRAIPAGATVNPTNCTVSGNVVTFTLNGVSPANGDLSYNFINIDGEGVNDLRIQSITASH